MMVDGWGLGVGGWWLVVGGWKGNLESRFKKKRRGGRGGHRLPPGAGRARGALLKGQGLGDLQTAKLSSGNNYATHPPTTKQ